jgi:hypothetical protein
VLAVRVERDRGVVAIRDRAPEPGAECSSLALVRLLTDDSRAAGLGDGPGVVAGAVVDHDHGHVP